MRGENIGSPASHSRLAGRQAVRKSRCLISSGTLYTYLNSSQEQLRKIMKDIVSFFQMSLKQGIHGGEKFEPKFGHMQKH